MMIHNEESIQYLHTEAAPSMEQTAHYLYLEYITCFIKN